MWGYLEYRGGVQYSGRNHEYHGVILSAVGILSTVGVITMHGDIMSAVGDTILCNLSTMGDIMIHVRGYHEYHGGGNEHPYGTHDILHVHHEPPTVLSIPHSTYDNPQGTHDIPTVIFPHSTAHTLYRVLMKNGSNIRNIGIKRVKLLSSLHFCSVRNFYLFCPKCVKILSEIFIGKLLSEFLKSEMFHS